MKNVLFVAIISLIPQIASAQGTSWMPALETGAIVPMDQEKPKTQIVGPFVVKRVDITARQDTLQKPLKTHHPKSMEKRRIHEIIPAPKISAD